MKKKKTTDNLGQAIQGRMNTLRTQQCLVCQQPMGDMPGSRDAICQNCGYKDPCCE